MYFYRDNVICFNYVNIISEIIFFLSFIYIRYQITSGQNTQNKWHSIIFFLFICPFALFLSEGKIYTKIWKQRGIWFISCIISFIRRYLNIFWWYIASYYCYMNNSFRWTIFFFVEIFFYFFYIISSANATKKNILFSSNA